MGCGRIWVGFGSLWQCRSRGFIETRSDRRPRTRRVRIDKRSRWRYMSRRRTGNVWLCPMGIEHTEVTWDLTTIWILSVGSRDRSAVGMCEWCRSGYRSRYYSMLRCGTSTICRVIQSSLFLRLASRFVPLLIFWDVRLDKLCTFQYDQCQGCDRGRRQF